MSLAATAAGSFAVAGAASAAATPAAIHVARRTGFLDRPREYRTHAKPTPLLGGAAVLAGFLLAALLVAGASGRLLVPLACAATLWLVGTIDDRFAVLPSWRLLAETATAAALFAAGLGWQTSLPGVLDFVLTVASIVIAVNAFNLMDNLDGACSSVTAVASLGLGALAAIKGDMTIAGMAFALSGACVGFLPWNLARPAKIFLGDGGSMPLGFLVAAFVMATAWHGSAGNPALIVGALLVGLPIFDAALVSFSRLHRGVPIMTGGRDHLTHRLLLRLRSPLAVAAAVAALQACLSSLALVGYKLGSTGVTWLGLGVFLVGVIAILALDSPRWRPDGIAMGRPEQHAEGPAEHLAAPAAPIEEARAFGLRTAAQAVRAIRATLSR